MKITPSRKTKPRYIKHNKTVKRPPTSLIRNYGSRVTVEFLEMLLLIKLYHWKTQSYATHKATDELYGTLNENMDKFIEILMGKTGSRLDFSGRTTISLTDIKSTEELKQRVMKFKVFLIELQIKYFNLWGLFLFLSSFLLRKILELIYLCYNILITIVDVIHY